MKKTIGIGVVGFGWMGQAHSRAYRNIPVYFAETGLEPRLVAVADNVPERAKLAVDNFGFAIGTENWRDLLERDDIDVIDCTAPTGMHEEVVVAAAAAGKHVTCEKPVGISPQATAAIENATRNARLGLAISKKHCRRATARNRIKRIIRESFREHQAAITGLDIVVINQPAAASADNRQMFNSLAGHWRRCSKAKRAPRES